jgi:hypothetical protein
MKRATYSALVFLLFATLTDAIAIAQNTQEPSPDPCVMKGGCVRVSYDRFQDRTFILMEPVSLTPGRFYNDLTLTAGYTSSGPTIKRPSVAFFIFISSGGEHLGRNAFETVKGVYLLIDGIPHPLGDVSFRKSDNTSYPLMKWTYDLAVPFDTLELIATGKRVEMRAGSVESTFDDYLKAAFQRLVDLAPKKADVASPAVKPPAPKRTLRRQRRRP